MCLCKFNQSMKNETILIKFRNQFENNLKKGIKFSIFKAVSLKKTVKKNSEETRRGKRMKNEQTEQLIAFDITRMLDGCGVKGIAVGFILPHSRLFKWRMKTQIILIQVDSMLHGWCSCNDEWENREWHNYGKSYDDEGPFSGYYRHSGKRISPTTLPLLIRVFP